MTPHGVDFSFLSASYSSMPYDLRFLCLTKGLAAHQQQLLLVLLRQQRHVTNSEPCHLGQETGRVSNAVSTLPEQC